MTLPLVVRVFFAVDLPLTIKDKMGSFIGNLKKASKSHAIRWTRPENLHVTLQFLAEVRTEHLPMLIKHVRAQIEDGLRQPQLTFSEPQLFPTAFRPRVIVLSIPQQEELSMLASLVGQGIQAANYPIENRAFRAHVTLGRIKHPHGLNLGFLSEVSMPVIEPITVNEVVLFRSEPHQDGSRYSVLERISLAKKVLAS